MNLQVVELYSSAQVRELDRIAIDEEGIPAILLMKRAAQACVDALLQSWPRPGKVGVLCGSGNNAGDGFIIAGLLAEQNIAVQLSLVGRKPAAGTTAAEAYGFMEAAGVPVLDTDSVLSDADLVVDALLGTGVKGEVRPEYRLVIETINSGNLPVLSVDLPSGLCADSGSVLGAAVRADVTVTFIGRKLGLLTNDGPEFSGDVQFASLGVPQHVIERVSPVATELDYETLIEELPKRHRNAHKVRHGHLLVVGGDHGMGGAVAMAAEAALYAGAGMVTVATRPENAAGIISRRPEIMARGIETVEQLTDLLGRADAVVLGPGLGRGEWSRAMFSTLAEDQRPLVVDADGLNLLSEKPARNSGWVLTPHPGEAARLIAVDDIQSDRPGAVRKLQQQFGGVVLLKGAGTLIASADQRISLCPYGNPGMAVAGMGDVLSGVIGGLVVQGLENSLAACMGATVHALAADRIVKGQGELGLLATELLPEIRRLLNHDP